MRREAMPSVSSNTNSTADTVSSDDSANRRYRPLVSTRVRAKTPPFVAPWVSRRWRAPTPPAPPAPPASPLPSRSVSNARVATANSGPASRPASRPARPPAVRVPARPPAVRVPAGNRPATANRPVNRRPANSSRLSNTWSSSSSNSNTASSAPASSAPASSPPLRTAFGPWRLKPHQVAVSTVFARPRTRGLLVYHTVGSGKTLAAVAAVENLALKEARPRARVLVVTPASLAHNFREVMRAAGVSNPGRYTVVSFDKLYRMERRARLELARGAVLVVDEVQNARSPTSATLHSLLEAARVARKRLLLTGTPVMNYPSDIGAVAGLLDPGRNEAVTVRARVGGAWDTGVFARRFGMDAQQDQETLDAMLRCRVLFHRPDAATMARHYPEVTERTVRVELTRDQALQQFDMAARTPGALQVTQAWVGSVNPAFMIKPREVNIALNATHPKLDRIVEKVVAEYRRGGKCVVYSSYREKALEKLHALLLARRVRSALYVGATTAAAKARMVDEYNAGGLGGAPDPDGVLRGRVLLLSDAGKEGLDLKNTTQVHVVEPQWNEDKESQVVGRAARFGSHASAPVARVDVFRYVATLPGGLEAVRASLDPGLQQSLLTRMSADEIVVMMKERKTEATRRFLRRLQGIARGTLAHCA